MTPQDHHDGDTNSDGDTKKSELTERDVVSDPSLGDPEETTTEVDWSSEGGATPEGPATESDEDGSDPE